MVVRRDDPMVPALWSVRRVRRETSDTFTLGLMPTDGRETFHFTPGQFNMLWVMGVGEVPISISGDPGRADSLEHTVRSVGAVTRAMARLRAGDVIGLRGPLGTGWPMEQAQGQDVIVVAGGIGLAPLRPVIHRLMARRGDFGRVALLYGTRTPGDILYRRELERWSASFKMEVHVSVDRAVGDWHGNVGVVTDLIRRAHVDRERALAMVCGPEVMMRFAVRELRQRGLAEEDIHVSLERNMECGIGLCGHCQCGPAFVCKDGPVLSHARARDLIDAREI